MKTFAVFTARCYASAVYAVVVCPSVTSRHCTKMAEHRIMHTTPCDSPGILVFSCQFPMVSPTMGAPNRGGVGSDWRFSTNILLYLRNGSRYGHSYYGTCSVKWPWTWL